MALYETVFIARQDISASQVEALIETFAALIAEGKGEVKKREYWGLRTLAFRIKKNRKGHYVLFNIDAPSAAVAEMERNMRINEDVLRYLTVRVDALEEVPSAVMQSRGSRDDRPRRSYGGDRRDEGGGREREEPREAPAPIAAQGTAAEGVVA
jgi:small subunit ribosomal protein S6